MTWTLSHGPKIIKVKPSEPLYISPECDEKPGKTDPINFEFVAARDRKAKHNKHYICDKGKNGSKVQ